jgi:cytochrome P450
LQQSIRKQFAVVNNVTIRCNLIGLICGAIDTTSKAIAQLVDQLLHRPDKLQEAAQAALNNNDQLLFSYLSEALRFNPQNTILLRFCESSYTIAKGTKRATDVAQGKVVIAATLSAMFDSDEVDAPNEFRLDRPPYHYLHFGYGLHTCFGQYINQVQITEISKVLLQQNGLSRFPGSDGDLKFSGPFPESMFVKF